MLIHCQHGIGRSALLALCVLVDQGWQPLDALTHAKDRRAQVSPSRSQYEGWAAWLRARGKSTRRTTTASAASRTGTWRKAEGCWSTATTSRLPTRAKRLTRVGRRAGDPASMPGRASTATRKLVGALIEAGQLLQGVADAGFAKSCDELEPLDVYALAGRPCCARGTAAIPRSATSRKCRRCVCRKRLKFACPRASLSTPFIRSNSSKRRAAWSFAEHRAVIGIRSIGTTLGAVVAAALDAPPPDTVRPFGDPFARQAELPPGIVENGAHYVIVDEGPGLSGSSFGAVADWLQARGVPLERIAFLPSHGGDPGAQGKRCAPRALAQGAARTRAVRSGIPARCGRRARTLLDRRAPLGTLEVLARPGTANRCCSSSRGSARSANASSAMARALHAGGLTPEPLGLFMGF